MPEKDVAKEVSKEPTESKAPKKKRCPLNKYVDERTEELEKQLAEKLNPLERLELKARIDELDKLGRHMTVLSVISNFDLCSD